MKKLILLLGLASMSFIGCKEEQSVISPELNESVSTITADQVEDGSLDFIFVRKQSINITEIQ